MVINSHGLHRSIPNKFGIQLPLGNHLQVDIQCPPNPYQDNHECTRTSIHKTSQITTLNHIRLRLSQSSTNPLPHSPSTPVQAPSPSGPRLSPHSRSTLPSYLWVPALVPRQCPCLPLCLRL